MDNTQNQVFDLIVRDLEEETRNLLLAERAVFLCFYRIALSPLDQQLLLKLVYSPKDVPVTPKTFANKHFGEGKGMEETRSFFKKLKEMGLLAEVQSNPTTSIEQASNVMQPSRVGMPMPKAGPGY